MGHIFVSYSHDDSTYAHALADHLHELGFEVWIDERLDYGAQWPQELQKQLDSCSAFILIMSPRSYASEWVQSELQRARRKLKPIFPLLLEGDEPWLSVESTQYYDVRGEVQPDDKFYSALKKVLAPTPAAQTVKPPEQSLRERFPNTESKLKTRTLVVGGIILIALIGLAAVWIRSLVRPSGPDLPSGNSHAEMVLIPAGEFTMGGNAADELAECLDHFHQDCQLGWFKDEEPVHTLQVAAFYIDPYEVTNRQYQACEEAGVCEPPQSETSETRQRYYGNAEYDAYPVIHVTWEQAEAYCQWREARLPSEAEWEKAARGTDGRTYPWGEGLDETLANFNWTIGDTTAVGSYESGRSPYGLYDMSGNVWEWVSSLHQPYPYDADDGRESSEANGFRIVRGGSWGQDGNNSVSTAYRFAYDPARGANDIGFRCARDASP